MRLIRLQHQIAALFLLPLCSITAAAQSAGLAAVRQSIRVIYDVPQLSTDSLASWLAGPDIPPILIDVRSADEFAVSHLRGARRLDPKAENLLSLNDLPRDTPVVTYCSVGIRSSAMARRLLRAGFTNVANLDGSIFAWANEGRTVYRRDQPVSEVHPYNALWGRLLDAELRAPLNR